MKQKKIIAREFLYLLSSFLFVTIIYVCLIIYNIFQQNRIKQQKDDIVILNNQYQYFLSRPLKVKNNNITQEKLDRFADFYTRNLNVRADIIYDHIPELNHDSILLKGLADYAATTEANKYKYKKEQNLKFPEFFSFTHSDIDSINYFSSKIELLHNDEVRLSNNMLSTLDTKNYIYLIGLLVFIMTFGLRYLYYATKWSIRIIKSNE